ncbi:MAG: hypothetical protein ABJJ69_03795 [Paracoccaceae bacterium]
MKRTLLTLPLVALMGCETTPKVEAIPLDDPRRAEQDARYAGTVGGASGISTIAIVGANVVDGTGANMKIDSRYSTPAEIAAAPEKVCAYLSGTVKSFRNEGTPSGNHDLEPEFIRYLYIECNV